ncbi:integrase [Actinomadura sp. 7K507]|nr:integrase [Actinomadura sp. 7K507]
MSADRVGAVLEDIGLLLDDRVDSLEATWNRRLEGVAPAIRADVNDWLRRLRDGGPRARPRSQRTIRHYIFHTEPILKQWSQDHDHLREMTAEEIRRTLDGLPAGYRRSFAHTALRSLFSFLHKNKRIFRNPTTGYKVRVADTKVFPLSQDDYRAAVAAAKTPAHRLALAFAAVHAIRPHDMRHMLMEHVDLSQRRLTVAGRIRPLDGIAYQALLEWLDYRRTRWPNTANPHLFVSMNTALDVRPVCPDYFGKPFRGLPAPLGRLRIDRHLEEALASGADPLHLALVFGLGDRAAVRYARAAREILESGPEPDA